MTSLDISIDLIVTVAADDAVPVEDELNLVMENLIGLTGTDCGIDNPAVSWDADLSVVTVEATVTADTWEEAASIFDSCVRSAVHGAGGRTPNWTIEKRSEHKQLVTA